MIAKIFFGIIALLVITFITLVIIGVRNDQEVNQIWRTLEIAPVENRFSQDMVAGLPAPVQRYFLHAIPLQMRAGWWFGTDRYLEFFRATIERANFR